MSLWDAIKQAGADLVARLEDALGGPMYPVHPYDDWVPDGGDGKFIRCSWPGPRVLACLQGHHVTDVLNLCEERDDSRVVRAAGMTSHRETIADGSPPSAAQRARIEALCRRVLSTPGAVLAFHCEANQGVRGAWRRSFWSCSTAGPRRRRSRTRSVGGRSSRGRSSGSGGCAR